LNRGVKVFQIGEGFRRRFPGHGLINGNAAFARQLERDFWKQLVMTGGAGLFLIPDALRLLDELKGFFGGGAQFSFLYRFGLLRRSM
jgi:hypothetical protein